MMILKLASAQPLARDAQADAFLLVSTLPRLSVISSCPHYLQTSMQSEAHQRSAYPDASQDNSSTPHANNS